MDITLKKGTLIVNVASYCGDESPLCTNNKPCKECNKFKLLEDVKANSCGEVGELIERLNI